ncbi:MAG: 50S ribosomal protein L1, partial [Pseudobdellovibrionaceae bacterium]
KLDFRVDKPAIVNACIVKKSMGEQKLKENFIDFMGAILKAKPATSKGIYLRSVAMSSTMGPGVRLDANALVNKSEDEQ